LKQVLMEATQKQVSEMANVKRLLQKYDAQIVLYLERVFREQAQMTGIDARKLAESAAVSAMRQAQESAGQLQDPRQQHLDNQAALLPRGFKSATTTGGAANDGVNSSPGGSRTPNRNSTQGTPAVNPLTFNSPNQQNQHQNQPSHSSTPRTQGLGGRGTPGVTKSPLQFTLGR
jgi:hypothetical protein